MGNKKPLTIFTDQDLAMSLAIPKQLPGTRHKLCLWHLEQNAATHFGELQKDDRFKNDFKHCLSGCFSEDEFEESWNKMLVKYDLENDEWFERLYLLRDKWCTALSKDFFSAGVLSSQRSESTNNAIGFKAKKTTTLTDFYRIFEQTVDRWRMREEEDEFHVIKSIPVSNIPRAGLLKQATEVYTEKLFCDFEHELLLSMGTCYLRMIRMEGSTLISEVSLNEDYKHSHEVTMNGSSILEDVRLKCTCKYFEEVGLLCYHILRIMNINNIFKIPECYILKRWTKLAKSDVWDKVHQNLDAPINNKMSPWRSSMMKKHYSLVLKCKDSQVAQKILEEGYERDLLAVESFLSSSAKCAKSATKSASAAFVVLDPKRVRTKGRNARPKSHFERKSKSCASPTGQAREFGSKTPIPRLF